MYRQYYLDTMLLCNCFLFLPKIQIIYIYIYIYIYISVYRICSSIGDYDVKLKVSHALCEVHESG
jgi:hypothetical protein